MVIDIFYVTEYPIRVSRSGANVIKYINEPFRDLMLDGDSSMPLDWLHINAPPKFLKHDRNPRAQLTVPFYGRMQNDEKLTDGHVLRIEGRVRIMPQSFSVTLQRGHNIWPQPTVSLFFSPNFLRSSRAKVGKAIITRSAYINGTWVNREVSRLHTHLGPGKAFVLIIACRKNFYELFVNSYSLLTFKHQMNPEDIDMVNIRGDVKLWNVVVERVKLPARPPTRSIVSVSRFI
ncbi:galectin-4 isoform X3 [Drosophila montana]